MNIIIGLFSSNSIWNINSYFKCLWHWFVSSDTRRKMNLQDSGKEICTEKRKKIKNEFLCLHCDYKTARKGNLQCHLLKHADIEEIKSYTCSICKYRTKHNSNLIKHYITHTTKKYYCSHCNYSTKYIRYVKRHILKHEPCKVCKLGRFEKKYPGAVKKH